MRPPTRGARRRVVGVAAHGRRAGRRAVAAPAAAPVVKTGGAATVATRGLSVASASTSTSGARPPSAAARLRAVAAAGRSDVDAFYTGGFDDMFQDGAAPRAAPSPRAAPPRPPLAARAGAAGYSVGHKAAADIAVLGMLDACSRLATT